MPTVTWTLTDVDHDLHLDALHVGPRDVGDDPRRSYSVRKRTLRGGLRDGVEVVEIDNGAGLNLVILPTRGMGLWRFDYQGARYGWQSPVAGPVHPRFVPVDAPSGIGWLQGFDELLVRCGLESNGAPQFSASGQLEYPLHGRIANLPARKVTLTVDPEAQTIIVAGEVDEARLFGPKLRLSTRYVISLAGPEIGVVDEVTNLSAQIGEFELLYHINLGYPLVTPGARLIAPVKTLVPRTPHAAAGLKQWSEFPPPVPGAEESVYFLHLAGDAQQRTGVLLQTAHGERAFRVDFDLGQLPLFAFWKAPQTYEDGYVTGLEPTVNWPNVRRFEQSQGRVVSLPPHGSRRFELTLAPVEGSEAVARERGRIERFAAGVEAKIFDQPQPGWVG